MLTLLAHHKLIDDREALVCVHLSLVLPLRVTDLPRRSLKDLLVRTRTNDLVTDLVNLDRVKSLMRTITQRRRYLAERDALRRTSHADAGVPEIIVDDTPGTPPATQDIAFTNRNSVNMSPFVDQDHSGALDYWDVRTSLADNPRSSRQQRLQRMRRTSDMSVMSADLGVRNTCVLCWRRGVGPCTDWRGIL
jgi:hypothetical protein